jgi:predicted TIM-barrel fold metal-dependent hydrolase
MVIIDFHTHIDESENANTNGIPVKMGRTEILRYMEEAGIDYSVLLVMAKKKGIQATRMQNEWLSEICKENKSFIGFGSVHPDEEKEALIEMERCVNDLGLKGLKLHPNTQQFDCGHPYLIEIMNKAAELDIPIILDSYSPFDDNQPSKIFKMVLSSSETKLCLAHVGWWKYMDFAIYGDFQSRSAIKLNVYFDLTAILPILINTPFQDQFLWICEQLGRDNLLFGSDYPFFIKGQDGPELCTPKQSLDICRNFGFQDEWIPYIIGENARKLLKLRPTAYSE